MQHERLRGVNLGGWLVLERWMMPALFDQLKAQDEYDFCVELSDTKHDRLQKHRDSFIQKSDFEWLATHGINAARIPVGHWIFDGQEPYVSAIEYLDKAMGWATESKLKVIIDFHAAPGSQNGWDHSGKAGKIEWHKNTDNIRRSLDIIEQLAERCKDTECLYGIELLNEPHWTIPLNILIDYYKAGYARVRKHCGDKVAVIISDSFRPLTTWKDVMTEPEFTNVLVDTHLYQAFDAEYKTMDLAGHLQRAKDWQQMIDGFSRPLIVGEWSLGIASNAYSGLDENDSNAAHQAYARGQLEAFQPATGQFFWNYKTETPDEWNFRNCYENGFFNFKV
jgi:glucan 1,3-beta-glucosidase